MKRSSLRRVSRQAIRDRDLDALCRKLVVELRDLAVLLESRAAAARREVEQEAVGAFKRGQRDGYVLCQNALQALGVQRLRAGGDFAAVQDCIDALSRVQP